MNRRRLFRVEAKPRLDAFAYLLRATARNRLRASIARLRRPRYALALVVGLLYLALIFYRPEGGEGPQATDYLPIQHGFALGSAFALALLAAKWWTFGASTGTLAFTPAEIQLLFPAPLERRDLILYRLLRVQTSMLLSAAFISLLLWRSGGTSHPLALPLRLIGLWILFATSFMHQMGVTLVRTAAAQRGRGLERNAPAIMVVGLAIGLLVYSLAPALLSIHSMGDLSQGLGRIGDALHQPIPNAILAPFRWIIAPAYSETTHDWLLAIGPALLLLVGHYIWVLRADAVFEDAAVDASARRAARLAARAAARAGVATPRTPGSTRTFIRLSPHGPAWLAIIWKNATAAARGLKLTATVRFTFVLVIAFSVARAVGFQGTIGASSLELLGMAALVAVAYLTFAGPLTIRNDLRADLAHLPTLRTYPLRGSTVVFAEILSSTLTLTMLQVAALAVAFAFLSEFPFRMRFGILLGALVILPIVNILSLTIQNAIALIVPAWVRIGAPMDSGQIAFEALGQRALGAIAALLLLVIALTPAAGAGIGLAIVMGGTPIAATVGILAGLAVAAVELWIAINWLGGVFERTDALDN
ncbi:MAG TPA: putative ABC exporter domain-containing protein [Gemmatimonadaceae bacterium]|nr:putative ABC exporter domain-containing protein [Gemmatimonadaceae bacterium]